MVFPFYLGKYEDFSLSGIKIYWNFYGTKNTRWSDKGFEWLRHPEENLSFRPLPCGYPGNLCLIASVRGMHCANGPTVFLFKTKIIKHLKWANKWPRKPNVCFPFILSRINLCYCCRKPVPRSQSSSWPQMYFIARLFSPLDICLFARGEERILGFQIWSCGFLEFPLLPLNWIHKAWLVKSLELPEI